MLSQFTDENKRDTLKKCIPSNKYPHFYSAGRLDRDSEGLLILTDNGPLQHFIAHPKNKLPKTYLVQVEGDITQNALAALEKGVILKDGLTQPALAKKNPTPSIWPRTPPIRDRKSIPTSWLSLTIKEGKNRQVRRMTAAVGFPTLRLIRVQIGNWHINHLQPGEYKELIVDEKTLNLATIAKRPKHSGHSNRNYKKLQSSYPIKNRRI